jgi:hypothetical protein
MRNLQRFNALAARSAASIATIANDDWISAAPGRNFVVKHDCHHPRRSEVRSESNMYPRYIPSPITECGLWLRAGILSGGVALLALVLMINGDASPVLALGWMLVAGVFSAFSIRRAWNVLDEPDEAAAPSEPLVVPNAARHDRPALQH